MKDKKVIVSLKGISKTYDNDVKVVKNIDLDIYEGEFLTILGASGCGKTTTLRMIAGFEDVSSGDICIDGSSVIGVPPYKRQVNTAFQSYALFPHLSVYDNIAYGLKVKKVSKAEIHERVSHMLSLIRLDGYEKRKPAQLSGGQKQRAAIVRALSMNPSVMLFDEVTASLDPEMVREVLDVIVELADSGLSMVIVTHEMEFARAVADRIVFLENGHVVEENSPEAFFTTPKTKRAAEFLKTFTYTRHKRSDETPSPK